MYYVNIQCVILSVAIQCVFSKNWNYHNNFYYNQPPISWNRGHRSIHQTVYFQNQPGRHLSQNMQMANTKLTVQTGFQGTGSMNFQTIPINWNSQNHRPGAQITWPNSFYNNNRNFHQMQNNGQYIQMHNNKQFYHHMQNNGQFNQMNQPFYQMQNIGQNPQMFQKFMNGQLITVENLNGKFEDFVQPVNGNGAYPSVSFIPNVQPPFDQGGAFVHGDPILNENPTSTDWVPPSESINQAPVSDTTHIPHSPIKSLPEPTKPPRTSEATTMPSTGEKQESSTNQDEQYDIDIRFGTE